MHPFSSFIFTSLLGVGAIAKKAFIQDEAYEAGAYGPSPVQAYSSVGYTPVQWNYVLPPENISELGTANDFIFMAPNGNDVLQRGGAIFNLDGTLVYSAIEYGTTTIFQQVTYKGEEHILLWTGEIVPGGLGFGWNLLLDNTYEVVANFSTVNLNGVLSDLHGTFVTPDGTAVMPVYLSTGPIDLTAYNGSSEGKVLACIIQEVDIETGQEIFTWNSLDHVDFGESFLAVEDQILEAGWDYFHTNALDKDDKGNYLISGRHTSTIYYVDGKTGEIIWRLGGKKNDFIMGEGTAFSWQHHVKFLGNDLISVFDNDASQWEVNANTSRGIVLRVNTEDMSVSLVKELYPFKRIPTLTQGSVQLLDNGGYMVRWGQNPYFSEYDAEGNILYSVHYGVGDVQSYRIFRSPWTGRPSTSPTVGITFENTTGIVQAHVSWNGATEIHTWELFGAKCAESEPTLLNTTKKADFETSVQAYVGESYRCFKVAARDANGSYLGYSDGLSLDGGAC